MDSLLELTLFEKTYLAIKKLEDVISELKAEVEKGNEKAKGDLDILSVMLWRLNRGL